MVRLTKIFRFETAHALHGYAGACSHVHGHSYVLHVTVEGRERIEEPIGGTGILLDFKELKRIVQESIITMFDHKLLVSKVFLENNTLDLPADSICIMKEEPSAENMLLYASRKIEGQLPAHVRLAKLVLWETQDSYAEWLP